MHTVLCVYGTRPEAIKIAPIVRALNESRDFTAVVAVTGQHREMLDQVNELFSIVPQYDLDIGRTGQSLNDILVRALRGLAPVLESVRPDVVMVQGDTSSAFAAAIGAFHAGIPVVHVEAGLRTFDLSSPWPEEGNRQLISRLASLHFAPTIASKRNLLAENIQSDHVIVTGNTVIDALLWTTARSTVWRDDRIRSIVARDDEILLVTTHRRESWGAPMVRIAQALDRLATDLPGIQIVVPVHRNPLVRDTLLQVLQRRENVTIVEPLDYDQFAGLMKRSRVVLTDSGGVQEEAPSLGKPVLVMRENTERPEAVDAGTVKLVGTGIEEIYASVTELWTQPAAYRRMASAVNPYGDGRAAGRVVAGLRRFFGSGEEVEEFTPSEREPL